MTVDELLTEATKAFEATFEVVKLGEPRAFFRHVDGSPHYYIEVCSGGPKAEGGALVVYDTAEDAIKSWTDALEQFKGKKYLYWRVRPEIEQDENQLDWDGKPNPTLGKWRLYSRFRVLD